jgi:triphosphoribosyl-dephospho-CoA synthase
MQTLVRSEDDIASCLQLAMLLEVSAYPKPGNIHRTRDFPETRYEHFLASAAALGQTYRSAAHRGIMISKRLIDASQAGLGKVIETGTVGMMKWQTGGNTGLGTILLLAPIAVAAGSSIEDGTFKAGKLRKNLKRILQSTTYIDSLHVYKAISVARPAGLGSVRKLDVALSESENQIKKEHIGLRKIFAMAAKRDSVASEWTTGYKITFEIGCPYFANCIRAGKDVNASTVDTFLNILSKVPDTLISRKVGTDKARYVSVLAAQCLDAGGVTDRRGLDLIDKMDKELYTPNHELNPGTTADIVSAVLAVELLQGMKT